MLGIEYTKPENRGNRRECNIVQTHPLKILYGFEDTVSRTTLFQCQRPRSAPSESASNREGLIESGAEFRAIRMAPGFWNRMWVVIEVAIPEGPTHVMHENKQRQSRPRHHSLDD